ncbi:hypothetical protein PVAND_010029 [Polypedilum vanderplanki]|uniref:Uncharacterized protein n=1 Tax=Polypedilum vanderplanki TaxID=319348 RepID=A0A9J6CFG3_POLVA|nr:hypothetical protein PVAND_010029 [Polypedilum vanderplanki]
MRPNTYDDTKAYCLCKVLVLPDGSDCIHMNDRIFANQNTENPLNFTIQSHHYPSTSPNMAPDIRITFYLRERGEYICFNQRWLPRLMKKTLKNERMCHFREHMDHGYFTFSSVEDPKKYLAFMRNGRPVNYEKERGKNDEKCRRIFKRITEESSNNNEINYTVADTSASPPMMSTTTSRKSSSRMHQKTHSKRIDMSKPRSTSRAKAHPVRHHHNELPLRHPHHHNNQHHSQQNTNTINNNNNNNNNNLNSYSNTNGNNANFNSFNNNNNINNEDDSNSLNTKQQQQQLGSENPNNVIYNNDPSNDKNVNSNNISDNYNEKVTTHHHIRHHRHRKPQQNLSRPSSNAQQEQQENATIVNVEKQEAEMDSSNCPTDDSDADKHLKGKKNVRGKNNAHANEKQQSSKCNNRKTKKNNENVRHSRKSSQKNSSHKTNP